MRSDAFSGGRAPRVWQRGIARAAAPLGALRRSAAWLAELARVRLHLNDGPLLGRCFQEIASQPFPTAEARQQEARPEPTRPRLPEPVLRSRRRVAVDRQPPPTPRRDEAGRRVGEGRDGKARVEAPMGLEPQVSREVLERLADSSESTERSGRFLASGSVPGLRPSPPAPLPAAHPDRRERGARARATDLPPGAAGSAGVPPAQTRKGAETDGESAERRQAPLSRGSGRAAGRGAGGEGLARFGRALRKRLEPLERLAKGRVGGALSGASAPGREGEGSFLAPTPEDPSPTLPRFAGEGATAHPLSAEDVPTPWRLTLEGDAAPLSLLERWVPSLGGAARSARPSPSPGPSRNLPAPPRDEAPPPVRTRQPEVAETVHQEPTLLPPPPSLPPFLRMNGAGDGIARYPAPEARPVLAPPAGPAVPPVEDLDALASKIQRILDDEARRHGIPV